MRKQSEDQSKGVTQRREPKKTQETKDALHHPSSPFFQLFLPSLLSVSCCCQILQQQDLKKPVSGSLRG